MDSLSDRRERQPECPPERTGWAQAQRWTRERGKGVAASPGSFNASF